MSNDQDPEVRLQISQGQAPDFTDLWVFDETDEGGGHLEMDTSVSPDGSAVVVIAIPLRLLFTELRRVQTIGFTLGDLRGMREAFDKVIRFLESPAARSNHLPHDN